MNRIIHLPLRYLCMKFYLAITILYSFFLNVQAQELGSNLTQKQAQETLDLHNEARAEVGVPLLSWSVELSETAQKWADHLAQDDCKMYHSEGSETGENLYWTSRGIESTPSDAVRAWYSEKKDYRNQPISRSKLSKIGHYTQMVWKNTTHVGVAMSSCTKGQAIVVAAYGPPGNYIGEKAY